MGGEWRGTLGSWPVPRPPTAHTRMPACTHTLTTGVAHGPGTSRAQQPPRKGASHERPLGQMPFPRDSCQACRNQLLLLQQLVPGLCLCPFLTASLPSQPSVSSRLVCPQREPPAPPSGVTLGLGFARTARTPNSTRGCTGRLLLPLLGFEMVPPGLLPQGRAGFISGCPWM